MLRAAYEGNQDVNRYFELLNWMLLRLPPIQNAKAVADRFHWHLKQTGRGLKEHRLLPAITHFDRDEAEAPLPISVYLDRIRSAHNIGSIIRTTEALRLVPCFIPKTWLLPIISKFATPLWAVNSGYKITTRSTLKRFLDLLSAWKPLHKLPVYMISCFRHHLPWLSAMKNMAVPMTPFHSRSHHRHSHAWP